MHGELKDLILQSVCRSAVRVANGTTCGHAVAYVIGPVCRRFPDAIRDCFPGCTYEQWSPEPRALNGLVKAAAETVTRLFQSDENRIIRFKEVREAVGIKRPQHFNSNVVRHLGFQEWLRSQHIKVKRGAFFR